jgi:hypothetical protein
MMPPGTCPLPPAGWYCLKPSGHAPPCIDVPRWWNVVGRLRLRDEHRR